MELSADALAMLDALPEPVVLVRPDGAVGALNPAAGRLLGNITGRLLSDFHAGNKTTFNTYLDRCRGSKNVVVGSLHLRTREGEVRFRCHGSRIALSTGTVLLVRLVQPDERFKLLTAKVDDLASEVKQRRHTQAVLSESLKERDLLLRELQHRVKNNMHMLSALLGGMEREAVGLEAKSALRDAGIRFGAVSAVQQLLYGSNLEEVQSEALVATVLKSACSLAPDRIEIDVKSEDFPVPIGIATSVALVLNEVLTNAVKYGRPVGSPQRIEIECVPCDGKMHVMVTDNGPGFSLPEVTKRSSGIGLVRGLLRQLGGSFAVEQNHGTRCRIEIPLR